MITLKTLPQATAQEVFDQITQHLLRQGKRSISAMGSCKYREETENEVLKCAAGCLIADDEYERSLENQAWDSLAAQGKVPTAHAHLIHDLQKVHDKQSPEDWVYFFNIVAVDYKLSFDPQLP